MRPLDALARRHGVQRRYTDHLGRRRAVSDESLLAVLRALGVAVSRPDDAEGLLASGGGVAGVGAGGGRPMLEPVLVRRAGRPSRHDIVLPAAVDPARVGVTVRREDGSEERCALTELLVGAESATGPATVRRPPVRREFLLPEVPDGYHHLVLEGPRGLAGAALMVAAPERCPQPGRGWGALAPLNALRTAGDWGVASYEDLANFGEWVGDLGGSFVGTLPTFATYLDGPLADPSPYRPASRVAWNELYVDVTALAELELSAEARRRLHAPRLRQEIEALRSAPVAEPVATMAAKRRVLEPLAAACAASPARWRALAGFASAHPEMLAYARFRAARELAGRAGALPGRRGLPGREHPRVRYHLYAQWVADTQLARAARRQRLYLDLPIGVHPEGFDPWWHPGSFVRDASAGAPPDDFFALGQVWGFNPPHPAGARADGYRYLVSVMRHAMRHASVVRIDHVMGLRRLWVVPDGMDAPDGAYVRYPDEELRAVVVLEAARAGVAVVGEDLGTVPPAVRRAMRRDGMLRSSVYQFEATPQRPFPDVPADAMASLGTHDLPAFAAWWSGDDVGERRHRGFTPAGDAAVELAGRRSLRAALSRAIRGGPGRAATGPACPLSRAAALRACLEHLAAGPARLVVVDPADLWGEREPHNRPGTGADEPNFRRRWAKIWPDELERPAVSGVLRLVDRARRAGAAGGSAGARPKRRWSTQWGTGPGAERRTEPKPT